MAGGWEFQLPTRIRFGRGGFRKLGEVAAEFGKSALLVGYREPGVLESVYAAATESLRQAGIGVNWFYEIPPDPDAELGQAGAVAAVANGSDIVIGVGGGSVLDAAKGIALLARAGGHIWDYTTANRDRRPVTDAIPVIAVPTTAGTGSEVTPVAVFTHHGVSSDPDIPLKSSISSPLIRPKVALIDPELTVGSPAHLTAACGADALGHAIEAYISRKANPLASALASRAVRLIVKNLERAVEDVHDPEPREPLALAATMAGAAFGSAGVVMSHAIAQALGSVLHIPHGEAVAIATSINLRYNLEAAAQKYNELAHYCGIAAGSPESRAERFVEHISQLLQSVGLPDRIEREKGVGSHLPERPNGCSAQMTPDPFFSSRDDFAEKLTRNAFDSTPVPLKLNPRRVEFDDLKQVFLELLAPTG